MYENIHTEKACGFDIVFSASHEYDEPDWDFDSEADKQNTLNRINNGDLVYFVARVQAFKNGILLGTDYLGGCCYDNHMQFVIDSYHYADMVKIVVADAHKTIIKLNNLLKGNNHAMES